MAEYASSVVQKTVVPYKAKIMHMRDAVEK